MLLCLLGSLAAAQQLLRSGAALAPRHAALGPWRGDGDAAPYAGKLLRHMGARGMRRCWLAAGTC